MSGKRFLLLPDLKERGIPFTREHLLRLEKHSEFPKRIHMGKNRIAWLADEVDAFINKRIAERTDNSGGDRQRAGVAFDVISSSGRASYGCQEIRVLRTNAADALPTLRRYRMVPLTSCEAKRAFCSKGYARAFLTQMTADDGSAVCVALG